jgi:hypothetical protein
MRLRRRWVLAGLSGLVLALPWLLWGGYTLLALAHGEHFYHGLPTSYWRSRLAQTDGGLVPAWLRTFPKVLQAADYLGLGTDSAPFTDVDALPMLADLLHDENITVRYRVVRALGPLGVQTESVGPLLKDAANDPSRDIRDLAAMNTHLIGAVGAARWAHSR